VVLELDDRGHIVKRDYHPDPRLMTGSELYKEFFNIHSFFAQDLGAKLDNYRFWARNPHRDDEHEALVQRLEHELREAGVDPGITPVAQHLNAKVKDGDA
jgi:hypothetical protein